jgi:hypothetical protein
MVDSLAMFFGAKKRRTVRRSPVRKVKKSHGTVVVKGRERKLFKGSNGGLYYKTKSGRTYVDAKFVRKHSPRRARASPKRRHASPKRRHASPKRRRASPKRRRASPKRRRASPKRRRASPMRRMRRTRWGYGLGQPSLIDMMGPAGLTVMPVKPHILGPGGIQPNLGPGGTHKM